MKKKSFIIFLIFLLFTTKAFSQNFEMKSYSDYSKGFKGASAAIYIGNVNDEETEEKLDQFMNFMPETAKTFSKLTKNNMWLCKQALNEWDYEKDECYLVVCAESKWANDCILLIVKILGKDDFDWFGISLTEKDLQGMESLQEE